MYKSVNFRLTLVCFSINYLNEKSLLHLLFCPFMDEYSWTEFLFLQK
jgi:hypothetical protein